MGKQIKDMFPADVELFGLFSTAITRAHGDSHQKHLKYVYYYSQ